MQKKFRVCIIGCGGISLNHIMALQENELTEICGVCDIIEERAKSRAEMAGCPWYTDYHTMLSEQKPDSAHICLPHYLHSTAAIDCMRVGVDVLCEKPMDASYAAAKRMKQTAAETGRRLGVIFQNRYNPENVAIKEALQKGEMGKLISLKGEVCWSRNQAYYDEGPWRGTYATSGGGVIINQAIHTLDLLRYFADSDVVDVRATVSHHGETHVEVEDATEGVIEFANGVRALFYFTINNREDEPIRVTLKCENARVESRAGDCCISYSDGRTVHASNEEHLKNTGLKACYGSSHAIQIDDFYRDSDGSRAAWMMEEALKTQALVDKILTVAGVVHP